MKMECGISKKTIQGITIGSILLILTGLSILRI